MSTAVRGVGLLILFAVAPAWGQAPADKKDAPAAPARWTLLFAYDDPAVWDKDAKNTKGEQVAIPLKFAPEKFRYLRLRRMDTGEALILPLTPDQLRNGKPHDPDAAFWWNGTAQEDWKGRHLGIVEGKRYKFPVPKDMIGVMTENWDAFTGSGFGHKCFVNDGQYYCWRGKEIKRTVFEIAVSDGPLSPEETRSLLAKP
jgi:hypothetical protein